METHLVMENNIASILFTRGIMPDDFISYSTYGAVAEIVKELEQVKKENLELRNKVIEEAIEQLNSPLLNFSDGLIYKGTVVEILNSLKTK